MLAGSLGWSSAIVPEASPLQLQASGLVPLGIAIAPTPAPLQAVPAPVGSLAASSPTLLRAQAPLGQSFLMPIPAPAPLPTQAPGAAPGFVLLNAVPLMVAIVGLQCLCQCKCLAWG